MHPRLVVVLAAVVAAWSPTSARAAEPERAPATGTWVGLRGGPPKLRTALAAALQTQASIRGIIDRAAVDPVSLQACPWSDLACFVELGARHDSRVILVGDLSGSPGQRTLRIARINVERGELIAEYHMTVDPALAAIDLANAALVGLTGEVVATPTPIATPDEAAASPGAPGPASRGPQARGPRARHGLRTSRRSKSGRSQERRLAQQSVR